MCIRDRDIPASNLKKAIANILLEEGYVKGVQVIADDKQGVIRIALKYTETGAPVISGIRRVSKPEMCIRDSCSTPRRPPLSSFTNW